MSSGQNACLIRATSLDFICEDHDDQAVLSTCDSFVCGGQVEPTTDIVSKDSEHMPVSWYKLVKPTLALSVSGVVDKERDSSTQILCPGPAMHIRGMHSRIVGYLFSYCLHEHRGKFLQRVTLHAQLSHQDVDGVTEQLAMSKAFFYKHRLNGECIQDGISNLLAGYPVLAGRLGRVADTDQACIWLVNGGVSFREIACPASSDCFKADELDMKQWMSGGLPAWIEVRALATAAS